MLPSGTVASTRRNPTVLQLALACHVRPKAPLQAGSDHQTSTVSDPCQELLIISFVGYELGIPKIHKKFPKGLVVWGAPLIEFFR